MPVAQAAPKKATPTRRAVLERAAAEIGTSPAQRAARGSGAKATFLRAARALAALEKAKPGALAQLRAEGSLPRDPAATVRKLVGAQVAADANLSKATAARETKDAALLERARALTLGQLARADAIAEANGHPGLAFRVSRLALKEAASDPKQVAALVAAKGERGAMKALVDAGAGDLLPIATETYLTAKADDWARKHQDLEWDNGKTLSDLSLAKRLRDPAFQKTAAKALLMNGLNWEGHQSPGHAVLKGLALIAEKGGEKTRLGEARLSEDEVAARVAELSRGTLGSTEDVRGLLRDVSGETDKVRFAKRLADRDAEAARHRGKIEPTESEKREAATGANRRKILADAMEKAEKPVHGYDIDTGKPVETKGAERMTAHSTRKAALIDGYRKQTGKDVVVDVPHVTEPDIYKRRANHREFMSRAFDETIGRPAEPTTGPTEGRAAGLGAAYDRMQSAETSGQEGATDV
jgi:hypothetical protein